MTLELNQLALQVKEMGQNLRGQRSQREEVQLQMQARLREFSTAFSELEARVQRAEHVQQQQRFDWLGAAPTNEPLAEAYPLPRSPEKMTIIASDGSQIMPDQHAITLYYLINVGSIIYQHGSRQTPITHNPPPTFCYTEEALLDEQGRLISSSEINVQRDLAELRVLTELAPAFAAANDQPVITLMDGQLPLRVIELPYNRQQACQRAYIEMLNQLRDCGALPAAYIDRPRSTFVVSLMHLAGLSLAEINEASLRRAPVRHLTDMELFSFLEPFARSAIFAMRAKGVARYVQAGQGVRFFYVNVSARPYVPHLARVEFPAWLAANADLIALLHAAVVRQARLTGDYPYVLARAHELAIISQEEREALEMMLAVEMRRHGLNPAVSPKQRNKNHLGEQQRFQY